MRNRIFVGCEFFQNQEESEGVRGIFGPNLPTFSSLVRRNPPVCLFDTEESKNRSEVRCVDVLTRGAHTLLKRQERENRSRALGPSARNLLSLSHWSCSDTPSGGRVGGRVGAGKGLSQVPRQVVEERRAATVGVQCGYVGSKIIYFRSLITLHH